MSRVSAAALVRLQAPGACDAGWYGARCRDVVMLCLASVLECGGPAFEVVAPLSYGAGGKGRVARALGDCAAREAAADAAE